MQLFEKNTPFSFYTTIFEYPVMNQILLSVIVDLSQLKESFFFLVNWNFYCDVRFLPSWTFNLHTSYN